MILRDFALVILCIDTFGSVIGLSYSNVYFQRSEKGVPVNYISYDAPASYTSSQDDPTIASVVQVPSVSNVVAPCAVPCLVPNPPVPNARLIVYNPSKSSDTGVSNYGYSYFIFDNKTGDKKAKQEVSDGDNIRGQYSVAQPDGYIREVQYIADDLNGFKAVTNFLRNGIVNGQIKEESPTEDNRGLGNDNKEGESTDKNNIGKGNDNEYGQGPPLGDKKEPGYVYGPANETDRSNNSPKVEYENTTELELRIEPLKGNSEGNESSRGTDKGVSGSTSEALTKPTDVDPYDEFVKCILVSAKNSVSPLAYFILPFKACP